MTIKQNKDFEQHGWCIIQRDSILYSTTTVIEFDLCIEPPITIHLIN